MIEDWDSIEQILAKLADDASRRCFFAQHPELISKEVVEQLGESVRKAVRRDVRAALNLADAALYIAQILADEGSLGWASRSKANALWLMGNCTAAVELFQQAARCFQNVGFRNELGRTLSTSIQAHALLGDYDGAFQAAAKAREIFVSLGDDLRLARLDINIANIYHRRNQFGEALECYRVAYERLLKLGDTEGIGVALHNIAVCEIALDDYSGALATYQRLRQYCEEHAMPLLAAQADYNIAYLYYLRGEYTQALELLRATRETCRRNNDTYHLGLCDLDQSEIYLELSLTDEAAHMSASSLDQFQALNMGFETARSLANLAIAVSEQGNASRALSLFAEAKKMFEGENNQAWPFLLDLYRAVVYFNAGQLDEARDLCLRAGSYFRTRADMPSKSVLCLLLQGSIALQMKQGQEAEQCCREALRLLDDLETPVLSFRAYYLMGQIHEFFHRTGDAYGCYQASRSALEKLRGGLQAEELKIGFMKNKLDVYARLAQLCLARGSSSDALEEAFSYIEEGKSRVLLDLIHGARLPKNIDNDGNELAARLQDLRKELNWYYHRIEREQLSAEGGTRDLVEQLKAEAKKREQQLLRLTRESPLAATVQAGVRGVQPASVQEIRQNLEAETALVEYFAIGDHLFGAVLTRKRLEILALTPLARLTETLRFLQFQMSKFRLGAAYVTRFGQQLLTAAMTHLRNLHGLLIAPLSHLLDVETLVIVPYGPLHSLPFQALHDGEKYLLDRFVISYAPSATIFALRDGNTRPHFENGRNSLILGVDDRNTPFIRREVDAVAAVVPGPQVFVGENATADILRQNGPQSQLIHIASHGYFRQDSPMFSAIRLADSYVSLYDLYYMDLPADLMTLSGCVTGLGVVAEGDELLGLSRGLLFAGVRSLLLTLWDIDDESAADFMSSFYSRLPQSERKAPALRDAMLDLRERFPHPFHWAPFKLIAKAGAN